MTYRTRLALAFAASVAAVGAASASDGRLQINQACVLIGCFPGDSAGFPVTITQSGSYQLTSPLKTTSVNTTAIKVFAGDVTIDLNGFAIDGPVTCDSNGTCSGQSSSTSNGSGIDASSGGRLTVHNGRVTGMGGYGIRIATSESILAYDLTVAENARSGIVANHGRIDKVVAERNGESGLLVGFGDARVTDSVFKDNDNFGVGVGSYCSGIVSVGNGSGSNCVALGQNTCETSTSCD